eukprot:m.338924 g.338924  ORF g.338924 m.338924 type:complete len:367 (+) comp18595_c0_seq1:73-1173(+)
MASSTSSLLLSVLLLSVFTPFIYGNCISSCGTTGLCCPGVCGKCENVALFANLTASSDHSTYGPLKRLTDCNGLGWHANDADKTRGSWLTFCWDTPMWLGSIHIRNANGHTNYGAKTHKIEAGTGENVVDMKWKTVKTFTNLPCGGGRLHSFDLRDVDTGHTDEPYKCIRLVLSDRCGGGHFSLSEVSIAGCDHSGTDTTATATTNTITTQTNTMIAKLQRDLDGATGEFAELVETQISDLKDSLQLLADDNTQLKAEVQELREMNKNLNESNKELRDIVTTLVDDFTELKDTLQGADEIPPSSTTTCDSDAKCDSSVENNADGGININSCCGEVQVRTKTCEFSLCELKEDLDRVKQRLPSPKIP